jgi:hypothetical protein
VSEWTVATQAESGASEQVAAGVHMREDRELYAPFEESGGSTSVGVRQNTRRAGPAHDLDCWATMRFYTGARRSRTRGPGAGGVGRVGDGPRRVDYSPPPTDCVGTEPAVWT